MSRAFRNVAIVGKYQSQGIAEPLAAIAGHLKADGFTPIIEKDTADNIGLSGYATAPVAELGKAADVAVVVGGDGTMLSVARILAPFDVPLVGVNQGRLGFMTDIALHDTQRALAAILSGEYDQEERHILQGTVSRQGQVLLDTLALNDVVVSRGAIGGMVELTVAIDGRFVYNQRADGLIVATPTGSTAYALSANGPILHPNLAAIVLVPVAPHALSNRPIALADTCEVEMTLTRGRDAGAHFDGQAHVSLIDRDRITVRRYQHNIRFLHPRGYDYFRMLREKLHWSALPPAQ
ncbi:MAG: NAD kinase [Burkholderiales bacterium]|nr:NAD kinase [Burkholderiales bacterium]